MHNFLLLIYFHVLGFIGPFILLHVNKATDQAQCYKTFLCSTQVSRKFILLINVKMPTIVGILTFISMINTSERLKAKNFFIFLYFSFYEQLNFRAQLS